MKKSFESTLRNRKKNIIKDNFRPIRAKNNPSKYTRTKRPKIVKKIFSINILRFYNYKYCH